MDERMRFCAVDRKPIGEPENVTATYYALTVNRHNTEVVMLVFCLAHFEDYVAMRAVVTREGWV